MELDPPQHLPVEPDPPPDLFEDPDPPPAPDYGAGPSLGPPGVKGGSRSYTKLTGEMYRRRGEPLNKTMPPEPMVPTKECTLVLQLLMEPRVDGGVCGYPTPSLQETIPDLDVLNHGESLEVTGLLTCHHYVGDIAPGVLQPAANQLPRPDGLDLQFSLVHLGWIRGTLLAKGLLKFVDLRFHKAHLVCDSTRNCTLCSAGASRF